MRILSLTLILLCSLCSAPPAIADDAGSLYLRSIKPLLKSRCYSCHGSLKQESNLRLDTALSIKAGGDGGPAVVTGTADDSTLIERISSTDDSIRMPPEGQPLTAAEIDTIRQWVNSGATAPPDERPEADPNTHWAFQVPQRPAVPAIAETAPLKTPIDAFIAAEYEQQSLQPVGEASKATLLRRLSLDLIGLPPTRAELHAFEADLSADAVERVVDRLLSSSQYGERWGRHWMDVWRYSDWYGRRNVDDVRNSYPHIWRWRDWIVNSLNDDVGYDIMIRQMLAADELYPEDDTAIAATGFVVRNWYSLNYSQWKKDLVEHTGKAFLGLRFNCAMCHDHKYDPISQREYFQLQAIFEPLELRHDRVPGGGELPKYIRYDPASGASLKPITAGLPRVYDHYFDTKTFMYTLGDDRVLIEGEPPVVPGVPAVLGSSPFEVSEVPLPPRAWYPGLKSFVRTEELQKRQSAIAQSQTELEQAQAALSETEAGLQADVDNKKAAFDKLWYAGLNNPTNDDPEIDVTQQPNPFVLLNAETGRRLLGLSLTDSLTKVDSQTVLSLRMKIVNDGHSLIHLGGDHTNGQTAAYLGFKQGHIQTYAPGSTTVVDVGQYDFASGQNDFSVQFQFDVENDNVLISVTDLKTKTLLVDKAVTPVRQWNPLRDPKNHFALDVQESAIALFDDILIDHAQDGEQLRIGFDEPEYRLGIDIAGRNGWFLMSNYNVAPSWSLVTLKQSLEPELLTAQQALAIAASKLDATRMAAIVAQAKHDSAVAEMSRLETRVAADAALLLAKKETNSDESPSDETSALTQAANASARFAQLQTARFQFMSARKALLDVECLADDNAELKTKLLAAQTACASARDLLLVKQQQQAQHDSTTLVEADYKLGPTYPQKSTGRRSALARWITDKQNPLTARVAVNHIWMRHFGKPLVNSVVDFGRSGEQPSHPELLDWLAVELMDSGWSMKHIHRLIVTSQVYLLDGQPPKKDAENGTASANRDPDNRYLWHFQRRRLEAEVIRDSILHLSGQIDSQLGGIDIDPKQSEEVNRRSLYFSIYPEDGGHIEFAELFDAPDPGDCYRRTDSIVPQQALALTNSRLSHDKSQALAKQIVAIIEQANTGEQNSLEAGQVAAPVVNDEQFVNIAFEQILSRLPTPDESLLCCQFMKKQKTLFASLTADDQKKFELADDPTQNLRVQVSLVRSLFNHADFVVMP